MAATAAAPHTSGGMAYKVANAGIAHYTRVLAAELGPHNINVNCIAPVGVYSSSKASLNGLTRSLAMEYGRSGIRCNAIAPGLIVGTRQREQMQQDPLEETINRDLYPVGRYGNSEDIANVALFLASDEAVFVTGIVLVANGGLTLQSPEAIARPSFRKRWRDDLLVPQPIALK